MRWILTLLVWLGLVAKPRFAVRFAASHPGRENLPLDDLVIVRAGQHLKWACFKCPCGCGETISLSLVQERRPNWRVAHDWLARPTLDPSVRLTAACHSHFWIREGRVDWCADTGRTYRVN